MFILKRETTLFLSGVVVLAALLAGCGGGSETSSLTKAQFLRRADAICLNHTHIIGPITNYMNHHANSGEGKDELTADAVHQTSLPQFQAMVNQIRALGAPAGDEREVERFLNFTQQTINSLKQRQKLDLFTDIDEAFTHAKLAAESYGLSSCL